MPIYAYKCNVCGHAKDVLQKMSADPLSVCPACGAAAFAKQLTAAGFQLKGSGWYVTDFRGGDNSKKSGADSVGDAPPGESANDCGKADSAAALATASAAPASAPAPAAAAPAAGTASSAS